MICSKSEEKATSEESEGEETLNQRSGICTD